MLLIMFKKLLKKLACVTMLACLSVPLVAAAACNVETKHPKVRITVEFNSKSYDLNYTLYRNMYPNTVRRFIELADSGFYSNMLIHDYQSNDWFSGGYTYDKAEYDAAVEINALTDYLEGHSKEQQFMELFNANKISKTVYAEYAYSGGSQVVVADSALPTLIGEFYNNVKQEIKKGELTAEQGTLKMFYYEKESTQKVHVDTKNKKNEIIWNADYKTNCATTLFAMQVSSSSAYSESDYCVFGKMESTTALTNLMNAISDYYGDDVESVTVSDVSVDNIVGDYSNEPADKGTEVNFTLPASPIVIKSVKVTKY